MFHGKNSIKLKFELSKANFILKKISHTRTHHPFKKAAYANYHTRE